MDTNSAFTDVTQTQPQQSNNDNSAFVDASGDKAQGSNAFSDTLPSDVTKAQQYVGSEDWENLCQVFFQQMTGLPVSGQNAAGSFSEYVQQGIGHQGLAGMKSGDGIFFGADGSNGNNGHVAIVSNILPNGDANIVSPDYTGIHMHKLSDWMTQTGQKPLGYVNPPQNLTN